jgi:HEAT repeat protein
VSHAQTARALYQDGQKSLNNEQYRDAAASFKSVYEKHADSKYAGDAMYWYAFSLYRMGGRSNLSKATDALEVQMERYGGNGDASSLYYRVLGERAKNGDEEAARKLEEAKGSIDTAGDDMETKMMAMEALLNMDEERSRPILKSVMANQSPETVELRKKAVFLLSQHEDDESVEMLVEAARSDPSREVREQAVFWLSQVESEAAVAFLEEILTTETDVSVQKKAVFAIAQQNGGQSSEILKRIALESGYDEELRADAIFWLGQRGTRADTQFLIELYDRLDDEDLKAKVIFSVSQSEQAAAMEFLMATAVDLDETIDMRKQALFWADQSGELGADQLVSLYSKDTSVEFRKQVVFVLSQHDDRESIDAMMTLARTEKNAELRKNLIFWIGQSDDPRAVDFLVEIINN